MLGAEGFEMVETVGRRALERHPVWSHYDPALDRARILAWGVDAARLDAEAERLGGCGLPPLYPVLELEPPPKERDLVVAAGFVTPSGVELAGYQVEPHAFGVFVGEREVVFNRQHAALSARAAERLGRLLGERPEALFPLHYESALRDRAGRPRTGSIAAWW